MSKCNNTKCEYFGMCDFCDFSTSGENGEMYCALGSRYGSHKYCFCCTESKSCELKGETDEA